MYISHSHVLSHSRPPRLLPQTYTRKHMCDVQNTRVNETIQVQKSLSKTKGGLKTKIILVFQKKVDLQQSRFWKCCCCCCCRCCFSSSIFVADLNLCIIAVKNVPMLVTLLLWVLLLLSIMLLVSFAVNDIVVVGVRKLKQFKVDKNILVCFYQTIIQSAMLYNQVCYFGNSKKADMERLDKVARTAAKIVGAETATPSTIYGSVAVKRLHRILSDAHHPLNHVLSSQVSRRASSQRLRCFRARTSRFRDSFLPTAVRLHNSSL